VFKKRCTYFTSFFHIREKINIYINVEREELLYMETLKVSSKSNPNSVAGALANVMRERGTVEVQAIGAGALNQAIKAIAIARGFVAPSGKNLICIPAFTDIIIDGEERTAIKLIIESR
jgi:stage V sporulation protein S